MNIDKKIELERLKHNILISNYKNLPKSIESRKKIPLLQYWFLPKAKKDSINEAIKIEKRYNKYSKLIAMHDKRIKKLEYKKAVYDIYFGKKDIKKPLAIEQKILKEPVFHHDHTKGYSWLRHPFKSLQKWRWRTFEKESIILINMQLDNGKHISFIRKIEDNKFELFERTYIIDLKLAYPSLSAGMSCLDYHQSYSLPIRRNWDVDGIKTAIESSGIIDCPAATNPSNITRFLQSNIIEQIFQGAALGKLLTLILVLIIISLIGIAATIVALFVKFNALEKLIK